MEALADRVQVVGASASRLASAARLTDFVATWSPEARPFESVRAMLDETRPDAVFNLTPAPVHADITEAALEAGAHVYSEKPLAATLAQADELIATASERGLLLLCAPASAVTREVRWLRELVVGGALGRPTLAIAQIGGMGPAAWLEYTGDPAVFYGPGVGPLRDIGIYRLHEMTSILGPVRRVQAMGAIAVPERRVEGGPLAGRTVAVSSPDHVLVQLEFANGALGQLLASFAVPATRLPWLEIHLEAGSISLSGDAFAADAPADVFARPEARAGADLRVGWTIGLEPPSPPDRFPLIGEGVRHFVACLRGEEQPVLTAEHARHVLEVMTAAYDSIDTGEARRLSTTF